MKIALVLIVLMTCMLATIAHADIRYRVRPRLGELVPPVGSDGKVHACGPDITARLWRTLFRYPVVTVHQDQTIDIDLGEGAKLPADDQHALATGKLIGYWSSRTPGITFGASIKERPTLPPRIEIVVMRNMDDPATWCGAKWVGLGDKF